MRLRARLAVAVAANRPATDGRSTSSTTPFARALRETTVKPARTGPEAVGPPPAPAAAAATVRLRARVAGAPLQSVASPVATVALQPPVPVTCSVTRYVPGAP